MLFSIFNSTLVVTAHTSLAPVPRPSNDNIHMDLAEGPRVPVVLSDAEYLEPAISATNFEQSVMDNTLVRIVLRERKKRGKASRKDLAQQAAAASQGDRKSPVSGTETNKTGEKPDSKAESSITVIDRTASEGGGEDSMRQDERSASLDSAEELGAHPAQMHEHSAMMEQESIDGQGAFDPNNYGSVHNSYSRQAIDAHMMHTGAHPSYGANQGGISTYPDLSYGMQPQSATGYAPNSNDFRMTTSPLSAYPWRVMNRHPDG
ncbi:hypothetical protein N0V93_007368 [Gnomoniopsis smithogilvyi]|uniref:Uncharacterized protein n=1 Tax=Gnomoniopsis smithogilvyi TaxID=1191159 RepID=A0A9W8YRG9_9PEZI|nr:hypothetical protein N0V93_007368 [Gnomoniopsis smithogilvyi]